MTVQALIKGWMGEQKTKLAQTLFLGEEYHVFNNIIIKSASISTQIDHIIVSKYGIFVVETKNRDGWIYGKADDEKWIETFYKNKYQFQNPLHQNNLHTRILAEFLGIDRRKIHSLVVFWGKCQFKTPMPENVLNNKCTGYIKSKKQILLTDNEVGEICTELQNVKNNTNFLSGWHHVRALKKRYESNTVCPKCGGKLIKRIAHTGKSAGQEFLGCEKYPRCSYTKGL
jgi:restriction system protein